MLSTGRLNYGKIYAGSFYMLGKIAEQRGQKAKARENYQKSLDLWKEAGPCIPEVEDAKKKSVDYLFRHQLKWSVVSQEVCYNEYV